MCERVGGSGGGADAPSMDLLDTGLYYLIEAENHPKTVLNNLQKRIEHNLSMYLI